jgi:preprotein translocase subunit YajC
MQYSLIFLQAASGGATSMLGTVLPLLIMFGIAYFLIFLPVQRQKKAQQAMLKSLENGQTVATSGGIIGTIVAVNSDDTLILRIKPDNLKIQVSRSAVTTVVAADEAKK